jgi:acetoin utilization deacetylase AcuC-like enzyme
MSTSCGLRVYYSPDYCAAGFNFDTTRKSSWIADSLKRRPISGVVLAEPEPLTVGELVRIHDTAYVEAVRTGEPRWLAESSGLTWDVGLWKAVCASNGGAVAAAVEAFRTTRNTGSLSSGLHHASTASGEGFCTFNGLGLAARSVIDAGAQRVLVIDLDAHGGGGSMSIMKDWPEVLHIDIVVSEVDTYEVERGSRFSIDIVRTAAAYLRVLRERLSALQDLPFDVLIYNAGMDPHQASLGGLPGITFSLLAEREGLVFEWALTRQVPVAFVLAGGYARRGLTREDLAGLHRLTVAAAAQANSGGSLLTHDIMRAAYAGQHEATEGFTYDANGRKTDAAFHADLLGGEDNDPFTYDGELLMSLSDEAQEEFLRTRHEYSGEQDALMHRLRARDKEKR